MSGMVYTNPIFDNEKKEMIHCMLETTTPEGGVQSVYTIVNKLTDTGSINPDFAKIISQFGEETITQHSEMHWNRKKPKSEEKEKVIKQNNEQEELFNKKLELFEIEEVKASQNRILKSKLRKAKNISEAYAYASAIVSESYRND